MGLPHKDESDVGPPAPTHSGQAPPPQPQQYPPASAPYAAEPRSPCPFPLQQQHPLYQQPQTPAFCHPPQAAVPFPPQPQQCYPSPATYPPSGPQQFNQTPTPVQGFACQNPYVSTPAARHGPDPQYSAISTTGLFDCFDDPANGIRSSPPHFIDATNTHPELERLKQFLDSSTCWR